MGRAFAVLFASPMLIVLLVALIRYPRRMEQQGAYLVAAVLVTAATVILLDVATLRSVTFIVSSLDGKPLSGISIIAHYAGGDEIDPEDQGHQSLVTDAQGKAQFHLHNWQHMWANIPADDELDEGQNKLYEGQHVGFSPLSSGPIYALIRWDFSLLIGWESYQETVPNKGSVIIPVRLQPRRFFDQLPNDPSLYSPYLKGDILTQLSKAQGTAKTDLITNLGGSILGFRYINTLGELVMGEGVTRLAAIGALNHLAGIDGRASDRNYYQLVFDSPDEAGKLYLWLGGTENLSGRPLAEALKKQLDDYAVDLVEAVRPSLIHGGEGYEMFQSLGRRAKLALTYYPEIFESGDDACKKAALGNLANLRPFPSEVPIIFTMKDSQQFDWASTVFRGGRTPEEMAIIRQQLAEMRSQATDSQIIANLDKVLKP